MAETIVLKDKTKLPQEVANYVKNNKWHDRATLIKGMKEDQFKKEWNVTDQEVEDVVKNTLWPGEKRKGNVIFSTSKRYGESFESVDTINNGYDGEHRFYKLKETYDAGYQVLDPKGNIVLKNVPKRYAEEWVLNKLDPALPKAQKFTERELMAHPKLMRPVMSDDIRTLAEKVGNANKGFELKDLESRPTLLYKAQEAGVISDGFVLLPGQDLADKIIGKHIEAMKKKELADTLKRNPDLEKDKAELEKAINEAYEKKKSEGKYPDWKSLIPEKAETKWTVLGASHSQDDYDLTYIWFTDGEGHYTSIDADKVAFVVRERGTPDEILSNGVSKYPADGNNSNTMVFKKDGKLSALVMPVYTNKEIPAAITEKAARIAAARKPAETHKPANNQAAVAIPAKGLTDLREINTKRSPRAKTIDGKYTNQFTIEFDNPKTAKWVKDPGSMDVLGVDTPPNVTSIPRKAKTPPAAPVQDTAEEYRKKREALAEKYIKDMQEAQIHTTHNSRTEELSRAYRMDLDKLEQEYSHLNQAPASMASPVNQDHLNQVVIFRGQPVRRGDAYNVLYAQAYGVGKAKRIKVAKSLSDSLPLAAQGTKPLRPDQARDLGAGGDMASPDAINTRSRDPGFRNKPPRNFNPGGNKAGHKAKRKAGANKVGPYYHRGGRLSRRRC